MRLGTGQFLWHIRGGRWLAASMRRFRGNSASRSWRRQIVPSFLAAFIGIAVSLISAGLIVHRDDNHARLQFACTAENHFMVLQNGLNEYLDKLTAVRALFDSSSAPVTRNEFEAFHPSAARRQRRHSNPSWVPRILNSERAAARTRRRNGGSYGLPHQGHERRRQDVGCLREHSEYYPIFYATLPKTSPLYGLDLRSEPHGIGGAGAGARRRSVGLLLKFASWSAPAALSAAFFSRCRCTSRDCLTTRVEERRRNLAGFVHGSIITGKMIDTIITATKTPKGLDLFFFAAGAGRGCDFRSTSIGSRLRTTPLAPAESTLRLSPESHWSRDLMADGQPWLTMVMRPMPGGPLTVQHDRPGSC